jgi:hypothetical protein
MASMYVISAEFCERFSFYGMKVPPGGRAFRWPRARRREGQWGHELAGEGS